VRGMLRSLAGLLVFCILLFLSQGPSKRIQRIAWAGGIQNYFSLRVRPNEFKELLGLAESVPGITMVQLATSVASVHVGLIGEEF
jgi:hypothetical protein